MGPKKGVKIFHNPISGEVKMFSDTPDSPWIMGRPDCQKRPRKPESNDKARQTMKKRLETFGPSEAELAGYKKQSRTRIERGISVDEETRNKISQTLSGRTLGWREGTSRAAAERAGCDIVYLLKITTEDGYTFGKWGSSKEDSFIYREKEFRRRKLDYKVLFFEWHGSDAPEIEAIIGRKLSVFPPSKELPQFFGRTECFEWCEATQQIIEEIIYGMEENPSS
jgi:hypothetical protein